VAQRFRDLLEDVAADWLAQQSGQGRETGRIVGSAPGPAAPCEVTDAAGCLVPAGQAYAVGADPDGALRWQPAWKRRAAERQAQAALARTRRSRT
jgi:hypothetical protein